VTVPAPAKYTQKIVKTLNSTAGGEESAQATFTQKNPWTLLLIGAGLVVIAVGLKKLWDLVKDTTVGKVASAADDAGKALVERLKAQMQAETDPAKLATLKDAVISTEAERDRLWADQIKKT
jgi:hypothetical protein